MIPRFFAVLLLGFPLLTHISANGQEKGSALPNYHLEVGDYFRYEMFYPRHVPKEQNGVWEFWVIGKASKKSEGWEIIGHDGFGEVSRVCRFSLSPSGNVTHLDRIVTHPNITGFILPEFPAQKASHWDAEKTIEGNYFSFAFTPDHEGKLHLTSKQHSLSPLVEALEFTGSYAVDPSHGFPTKVQLKSSGNGPYSAWLILHKRLPSPEIRKIKEYADLYFKALYHAEDEWLKAAMDLKADNVVSRFEAIARWLGREKKKVKFATFSEALGKEEVTFQAEKEEYQKTHDYFQRKIGYQPAADWDTFSPLELIYPPDQVGKKVDLKAMVSSHKATVLDFCHYHCPGCPKAMVVLDKIRKRFEGKPVAFLGLNMEEETERADIEGMKQLAQRMKLESPIAFLGSTKADSFEILSAPVVFVVSKSAIVSYIHLGFDSRFEQNITEAIRQLLN